MKKNNKKKNILLVLYFWVNLASWIWSDSTICVLATQQQLRVSTLCVCLCVNLPLSFFFTGDFCVGASASSSLDEDETSLGIFTLKKTASKCSN